MTERIVALITQAEARLPLRKRTAAVIGEIHALQDRIETCQKGSLEITIDFTHGTIKPTVREVGEARRIE